MKDLGKLVKRPKGRNKKPQTLMPQKLERGHVINRSDGRFVVLGVDDDFNRSATWFFLVKVYKLYNRGTKNSERKLGKNSVVILPFDILMPVLVEKKKLITTKYR